MNKEEFTIHFDQWYKCLEELEVGMKTAPESSKNIVNAIKNLLISGINWPTLSHIIAEIQRNHTVNSKIISALSKEIENIAKHNSKVIIMIGTLSQFVKIQGLCMKLYECAENILEELIQTEQKAKKIIEIDDRTGSETINIPDMTLKQKEELANTALDQFNKGLIDKDQLRNRLSQLAKINENVVRTITGFGNIKF